MADYWKSIPRHFCEFCKCWTADNKASREFHEKGKRHQESVEKKLTELRKKGVEDARRNEETASYLVQMEKAALKKLKEDIAANPNMASQYGVTIKSKFDPAPSSSTSAQIGAAASTSGEWQEAYSPEGYVYYWNSITQESRWELPTTTEADTSPAQSSISKAKNSTIIAKPSISVRNEHDQKNEVRSSLSVHEKTTSVTTSHNLQTTATCVPKKKIKKDDSHKVKEEAGCTATAGITEPVDVRSISLPSSTGVKRETAAPAFRSAYGSWQTVATKEEDAEPEIDYQLPDVSDRNYRPTVDQQILAIVTHEPKLKFTEKKVTTLASTDSDYSVEGTVKTEGFGFKKRKLNSSVRNIRVGADKETHDNGDADV